MDPNDQKPADPMTGNDQPGGGDAPAAPAGDPMPPMDAPAAPAGDSTPPMGTPTATGDSMPPADGGSEPSSGDQPA